MLDSHFSGERPTMDSESQTSAEPSRDVQNVAAPPLPETYELKFVVDRQLADAVMAWGRENLSPDPHADMTLGDGYQVHTLYLDTPQFDVFHREEHFRRRKFRVRRYGNEAHLWLEVKKKKGEGRVRKQRTRLLENEAVDGLAGRQSSLGEARWFGDLVQLHTLQPSVCVSYRRFARVGGTTEAPVRLTVDSELRATKADGWRAPTGDHQGACLLGQRRIVELKFRDHLPAVFRGLIQDLELQPGSFSKYRTSIASCVLPPDAATDTQ